ncbi:SDR family NAD(P)-dependent oxidoreductase [Desertibacillus haloalkaliphilus]|uniref:SDR family NAD(P)-dependent oxidoreductase n=1 Tax=Desertibacillus haloalkaliphilus TaxID=1328930 RepID=UPI001C271DF9|nr:SDR family oxidoreductase [Desertibacillus haloalkaliphilus]MBU8907831.1 SDR family oxidoreductase [Desertibacillus haloalkaliphilus]
MGKQMLTQKVIVITGASSGIGAQLAYDLASYGATPVLLARSVDKLETHCSQIEQKTGVKPDYYQLDVTSLEDVQATFLAIFHEHKHIDVLVNNAGFAIFDSFLDADLSELKAMFDVNVYGMMACTKAVLPSMIERNQGHIINIGSLAGKLATPKSSGYAATKHAVLGFTNGVRLELQQTNVHVTSVNPGPIKTPFFETADQTGTYVKNVERMMLEPTYVSSKIIDVIRRPKREVNVPTWMSIGTIFYQLFPGLIEKFGGKKFNQK